MADETIDVNFQGLELPNGDSSVTTPETDESVNETDRLVEAINALGDRMTAAVEGANGPRSFADALEELRKDVAGVSDNASLDKAVDSLREARSLLGGGGDATPDQVAESEAARELADITGGLNSTLEQLFDAIRFQGSDQARDNTELEFALEDLTDETQSLREAIEALGASISEGVETRPSPDTPRPDPSPTPETPPESFFERLSKNFIRPALQASFTQTLFRNNAERTGLGVLRRLAGSGNSGRGVFTALRTAGASKALAGLAGGLTAATTGLAAFVGGTGLAVTALVGAAKGIGAATNLIARDIQAFSPNIAVQQAENQLSSLFARQEQAAAIGPEIAAILGSSQGLDNSLRELVTEIVQVVGGPADELVKLATTTVSTLVGLLDALEPVTTGGAEFIETILSTSRLVVDWLGFSEEVEKEKRADRQAARIEKLKDLSDATGADQFTLDLLSLVDTDIAREVTLAETQAELNPVRTQTKKVPRRGGVRKRGR